MASAAPKKSEAKKRGNLDRDEPPVLDRHCRGLFIRSIQHPLRSGGTVVRLSPEIASVRSGLVRVAAVGM